MDVRVIQSVFIAFSLCSASHEVQHDLLPVSPSTVALEEFPVRMPNVRPLEKDTYLCSSHHLPHPEKKQFIVEFVPHANESTAHHMLVFGCKLPYKRGSWNCGDMGGGLCSSWNSRILFGWAKNAQGITMPPGVGFAVGGNTGINYLVLQIHYGHVDVFRKGATDNSGLTLHLTNISMPNLASIYLLYAYRAHIAAHSAKTIVEIACEHHGAAMHPFAFRVHAHSLGKRIMAYRVRDNHWTKIAVGSPQNPQAFYPLEHAPVIEDGDIIAARCEFDASSRDTDTGIGSHGSDEMCNFYLMYFSPAGKVAYNSPGECGRDGRAIWSNFHESEYDGVLSTRIPPTTEETQQSRGYTNGLVPSSTLIGTPSETEIDWHTSRGKPSGTVEVEFDDTNAVANSHMNSPEEDNDMFGTDESQDGIQTHLVMQQWPVGEDGSGIVTASSGLVGQVSGVDVNRSGIVYIFHRGPHVWDYLTFDDKHIYRHRSEGPITVPTVLALDSESGSVVQEWGQHRFYMPHGLTVDSQGNVWLTDVALHQVFKFAADGGNQPLLELGEAFVPGSDHQHFCKPADVAVLTTGAFLVADGYCNKRIIRFHPDGRYDTEWTAKGTSNPLPDVSLSGRQYFNIPHSLALSEQYNAVCVADRENGRVLCYRYDSGKFITQVDKVFGGQVFAIAFSTDVPVLFVVNGPISERVETKGFTVNLDHVIVDTWNSKPKGFTQPHDVAVGPDGSVYVVEIGPNRVWKFSPVILSTTDPLVEGVKEILSVSPVQSSQESQQVTASTVVTTETVTPSENHNETPHSSSYNPTNSSLEVYSTVNKTKGTLLSATTPMDMTSTTVPVPVTAMNTDDIGLKTSTNFRNDKLQVINDNNSASSSVGFHASLLPIIAITCIVAVPLVLLLAFVLARYGSHTKGSKQQKKHHRRPRHNQYRFKKLHQEDGDVNSDTELL